MHLSHIGHKKFQLISPKLEASQSGKASLKFLIQQTLSGEAVQGAISWPRPPLLTWTLVTRDARHLTVTQKM